jgi:EAL domain-containing protein (putative c-di-GMP-specific phosphodiesterase class I)/GGDEF domain-containing protein
VKRIYNAGVEQTADAVFYDLAEKSPNLIIILNSNFTLNYCNAKCFEHIAAAVLPAEADKHPLKFILGLNGAQEEEVVSALKEKGEWGGELKTVALRNIEWMSISAYRYAGLWCFTVVDNTDKRAFEASMKLRLNYDRITSLPNVNLLYERLGSENFSFERGKLGLVNITVNSVNYMEGIFGARFINQLLKVIANTLLSMSPSKNSLFYTAAGEFVFIIERDSTEKIYKFARAALSNIIASYTINRTHVHVGANAGVSVYPDDTEDVNYLLPHSRAAFKSVKNIWGGEVVSFSKSVMNELTRRLTVNQLLHSAIDNNEFSLVFQPKYDTYTKLVVGAEVLIRWTSLQIGSISPMEFIPVAEEFGHAAAITNWVFRQTCRYAKAWKDEGIADIAFAVNVPALQLYDLSFVSELKKVADEEGFPLAGIDVELTETILVDNASLAAVTLKNIQNNNMRIAIDDFGTGYSSLSYLAELPIDYLKIDRSFIMKTPEDEKSRGIVSTIILMGKNLGLKIIAEGVETPEQYEFLKNLGCDQIQGFLFSKPLSPSEFVKLMLREKHEINAS